LQIHLQNFSYLRTEAYPVYQKHIYPPKNGEDKGQILSYEKNIELIDESKKGIGSKND
jgi:hypothetical protein